MLQGRAINQQALYNLGDMWESIIQDAQWKLPLLITQSWSNNAPSLCLCYATQVLIMMHPKTTLLCEPRTWRHPWYLKHTLSHYQLRESVLQLVDSLIEGFIWHQEPFALSVAVPLEGDVDPHLQGEQIFGGNVSDEWLVCYLLFTITSTFSG